MENGSNITAQTVLQSGSPAISFKPLLGDVLLQSGKKHISIPDYIKSNAKTRRVAKLRKEFEELIKHDERFYGQRTSEIFITLGKKKGNRELKYYPKVRNSYYSHVSVM